ncbi:winged helix-turn-helix transcriptional regulator [Rossellomorea vietnamensis]|uniref:Winged helix-turn-helix transcriptional regulator n=1 Tax=Rossellomorea vietnamensis TaxID=218284 RepID=A0A5D4MAC9_9BACI|nr:winged helix-turn-helix transcriptional regulator [Rossellomorea vietnamensis]TYR98531.1 winged helix-turn-helix transcriptional regulator [Rossellomorea vietnamensis]
MDSSIEVDENGKLKCSIEYTLNKVGGKWKLVILWHLAFDGMHRYNELRRLLPGITHKMLSQQLKELEQEGLINRKQYNEVPPKVEYSISEKGETLKPLLKEMHKWGSGQH